MQRDMDLVRKVLIEMEKHPAPLHQSALQIADEDDELVSYHVMLLEEAGFITAVDASTNRLEWIPGSLTWNGHEMLDAMRNDTVWRNFKAWLKKQGVISVSLGTVFEVLRRQEVQDVLRRLFLRGRGFGN